MADSSISTEQLEYSVDGTDWKLCGGHEDLRMESPHTDNLKIKARYFRVTIIKGVKGVWEWNLY